MLADLFYKRQQQLEGQPGVLPSRTTPVPPLRTESETTQHENDADPVPQEEGSVSSRRQNPSRTYVTSAEVFAQRGFYAARASVGSSQSTPSRPLLASRSPKNRSPPETEHMPVAAHQNALQYTSYDTESVESAKVLRFSTRNTHQTANSIRAALQETLNEKSAAPPIPLTDEYLATKRHLFFETLFTANGTCLLPAKFTASEDVERMFDKPYDVCIRNLSGLWERLQ